MKNQLERVKRLHDEDLSQGFGEAYLPEALARKYPSAAREFRWQYVFPARKRSLDPRTGVERRHHLLESVLQKAVKVAVARAGITISVEASVSLTHKGNSAKLPIIR